MILRWAELYPGAENIVSSLESAPHMSAGRTFRFPGALRLLESSGETGMPRRAGGLTWFRGSEIHAPTGTMTL